MNSYGRKEIEETKDKKLETWEHRYIDSLIHIEHPEYTALCPRSGYPDFGTIVIDYIPDGKVCELKALKLYINSFREESVSHENVVNIIADKFLNDVNPHVLRVIGDFTRRGGVKMVVTVYRGEGSFQSVGLPAYNNNIL